MVSHGSDTDHEVPWKSHRIGERRLRGRRPSASSKQKIGKIQESIEWNIITSGPTGLENEQEH